MVEFKALNAVKVIS